MRNVVLFGAGEWGRLAYLYYKSRANVLFFVDNAPSKQGGEIDGVPVRGPDVLDDLNAEGRTFTVVITSKINVELIERQLASNHGIHSAVVFDISNEGEEFFLEDEEDGGRPKSQLIVQFSCGLGNQMFQYALYRQKELAGFQVAADLTYYIRPTNREFLLERIFPNIRLWRASPVNKKNYLSRGPLFLEQSARSISHDVDCSAIEEMGYGYLGGFFQTYVFCGKIRNDLLRMFDFSLPKSEHALSGWATQLQKEKCWCSIHVRLGDYLSAACRDSFGGVCGEDYYRYAIEYIQKRVPNVRFLVFSEDLEWVKCNLDIPDATMATRNMFDDYEDWYDMYLMSLCAHNIIANSTFSWWGAWLNKNPDKIVVAPKRWRLDRDINDICPPDWIRL